MRERKPKKIAEPQPTQALRRSPRFLARNQIAVVNPETPKPAPRKLNALDSFSTPLVSCITKIQENDDGVLQNGRRKDTKLKILEESGSGCRRSARLKKGATRSSIGGIRFVNGKGKDFNIERGITELRSSKKSGKGSGRSAKSDDRANVSKCEGALYPQKQYAIDKMVTRSSVCKKKAVTDSCKENIGIEKRVTRSSSRTKRIVLVEKASNVSTNKLQEVIMTDDKKRRRYEEIPRLHLDKIDVKDCGVMMSGDKICEPKTRIGEKRKRYQVEEDCEVVQGWTKEQELVLRRAYFTAKPTPQFWKEVAKMVPGKSAKECFDRIHSDHLTPSQPRTRSRAKKEPSPISLSASKLLSPAKTKSKKLRSRRSTLVAHKTVRQLLQKQHNDGQDYEADLFAVLEPSMDSSPLNFQEGTPFASPASNQRQMSSSSQRKQRSRLSSSHKAAFVSPLVLKQIKNKALHEKYIDQLHSRDARRKAAALRNAKITDGPIDKKVSLLKPNIVKVAKDALVSDAQDAISQLRNLQSGTDYSTDNDDSTCLSDESADELC